VGGKFRESFWPEQVVVVSVASGWIRSRHVAKITQIKSDLLEWRDQNGEEAIYHKRYEYR